MVEQNKGPGCGLAVLAVLAVLPAVIIFFGVKMVSADTPSGGSCGGGAVSNPEAVCERWVNGKKVGEVTAGDWNKGNTRIKRFVGGALLVVSALMLWGLFKLSRILVEDFRGSAPHRRNQRRE